TGVTLWTGTYNGRERQTNVCPGPTVPLVQANQDIARFTVSVPCVGPTITVQPTPAVTSCSGQPLSLTVSSNLVSGTFEWFRDTVSLGVSTNPTLTIASTTVNDNGVYRCVLRDNCNPTTAVTTSSTSRVTIIGAPTITVQPAATRVVCENGNDTLRIRGIGGGIRFQWFKDGAPIAGATDSNFVINNASAASAGNYWCVVSGTCSPSATSAVSAVSVAIRPRITRQPTNLDVCPGSNNTVSVAATGNNLAYQWYRNGQIINGQTSSSIAFNNYDYSMNGQYYCIVRSDVPNPNNCPISVQSTTIRVAGFRAPTVTTQPKSVDACAGTNTTLVATFGGTGLSFQWFKDGQAIDGQTANAIVIAATKPSDAGRYTVTATGTCGLFVRSDTAVVTVLNRPTVTKQPESATLTSGDRLALSVEGTDVRTVQWFKNEVAIKDATTTSFSISRVVKSDAGFYTARITNGCGGVVSASAKVVVNDPVTPRPAIELSQTSVDFGEIPQGYNKTVNLSAVIKNTGNAPLTITALNIAPSDFSITNAPAVPFDIAPGGDQSLTLVAAPTRRGSLNGTLTIRSNATSTPQVTIALSAAYVLRYTAATSQDFGVTETGKPVEKCMTVTNTSAQEIAIDQASFTGTHASDFSMVTTLPVTIAAGASAELCVKFSPIAVGQRSAQMALRSANGGNTNVDLSGTAETPGGVVDAAEYGLTVGPNPARESIEIRFGRATATMEISLVDASGRAVATMSHDAVEAGSSVRMSSLNNVASGSYMLTVRTGTDIIVVPVSIVR
ncbi:MAG: choice-of-anchor D domain-containing protein, partial [Candidatus Kapabacteria bacterium]|nr:choice-of-anchor D domain-containing protein [Candidatus Kapabacteria bacterium]